MLQSIINYLMSSPILASGITLFADWLVKKAPGIKSNGIIELVGNLLVSFVHSIFPPKPSV